jgi:flagellar hook-basal body complex protein FliE
MSGGPMTRWHGANAKKLELSAMSRSKVFQCSQSAEQNELLSYLFETSFKNALKNTSSKISRTAKQIPENRSQQIKI